MNAKSLSILVLIVLLTMANCTTAPSPASPVAPSPTSPQQPAATEEAILAPTATANVPTATARPALQRNTQEPSPSPTAEPALTEAPANPFDLLSPEQMLATIEDLASIQPYSGWRNSASEGEAEALDYLTGRLDEFDYLQEIGLELERQVFHVFMGMDLWETRLHLTVGGQEVEVPADGLRGPRDDAELALRFDSDGALNDEARNPVTVQGPVLVVRSAGEVRDLTRDEVEGRVVFLDYAAIDRVVVGTERAVGLAADVLEARPAGLVLVTEFSNTPGESHGTFVGDASALTFVESAPLPPTLYVRLEDLAPAGVEGWDGLARVEQAHLTWDADVFSPAESGNLIARIPSATSGAELGGDPAQAIILGAHVDSPNAPGALDDGSGSAILLEIARVLDEAQVQPPTDLYLCWFGSEELGLYGSSHFVATHQELLDRTRAMLQTDMLGHPLDGLRAELRLVSWSHARLGGGRLAWPEFLADAVEGRGIEVHPQDVPFVYSDDSSFGGFDVPHADLIYEADFSGSVHYATHIHDPYDTVALAREMDEMLAQMAQVVLTAALEPPADLAAVRVTPRSDRRAVFVASHTEAVHMTPIGFRQLGMALAMEGFDVDLVPYGQPVTPEDLEGADLVVALPVMDYPGPGAGPDAYDEAWTDEEAAALETYAAEGGLLVLTNSAHRLKYGNRGLDPNEDWADANALARRFGVAFQESRVSAGQGQPVGESPLLDGLRRLELSAGNGVPFSLLDPDAPPMLVEAEGTAVVALLDHGAGQVLVLADVALLTSGYGDPQNLPFWRNLAEYARAQ